MTEQEQWTNRHTHRGTKSNSVGQIFYYSYITYIYKVSTIKCCPLERALDTFNIIKHKYNVIKLIHYDCTPLLLFCPLTGSPLFFLSRNLHTSIGSWLHYFHYLIIPKGLKGSSRYLGIILNTTWINIELNMLCSIVLSLSL